MKNDTNMIIIQRCDTEVQNVYSYVLLHFFMGILDLREELFQKDYTYL